jgi:hypothetical protein
MAFDQTTRNRLARFVSDARALLTEEFTRQLQNEYGLDPASGDVTPIDRLTALDDRRRETAKILRETLEYYLAGNSKLDGKANRDVLDRIVREQAFTVLNRLCALRMSEARGLVLESIAKGYQSKGFQLYARLAGSALGETGEAYRIYLFSLMDEIALDLTVLFDRFSPQGRLFPREAALLKLLEMINDPEIETLWAEDETIGWIYQYFNSKEERKAMRDASQAPRNSRELAVRNQFFTPRYVVEFLTDNTLGRIWYEMTRGETVLKDSCRYLVRRKHSFFLEEGQEAPEPFLPEQRHETNPDLAHEMWLPPNDQITDLGAIFLYGLTAGGYDYAREQWGIECGDLANEKLKQYHETGKWEGTFDELRCCLFFEQRRYHHFGEGPEGGDEKAILDLYQAICERWNFEVEYIPHRPLKDPREIKMLDPACGSMHFGLYAFDLFEQIYAEAWELEERLGEDALQRLADLDSLHKTYPDKESYLKDVPRLIIERNIHGVDIDPRAVQIAGLSLWLRAQKSWQAQGLRQSERPQIRKSNVVCAEPMPGDRQMLEEFLGTLRGDRLEALMRKAWHVPADQKVRATPQMADALAKLVRTVWNEMELAGEAGSLLKIEETLRDAIAMARKESEEKAPLFRVLEYGLSESPKEKYVQVVAGEDQDFFDRAEGLVLAALNDYAEQAENGLNFRRRLFTSDAAQGFDFINLCRKSFDVFLMNPPFGAGSVNSNNWLKNNYTYTYSNLGSSFVERAASFLVANGKLGVIIDIATSVRSSYTNYRYEILYKHFSLSSYAHLGWEVLDANVEVCCFTATKKSEPGTGIFCLDATSVTEKGAHLLIEIQHIQDDLLGNNGIIIPQKEFMQFPNGVPNFTLLPELRKLFTKQQSLSNNFAEVKTGLSSGDNSRFYKLEWEIPISSQNEKRWFPLSNGGEYMPYYRPFQEVIDWKSSGEIIKLNEGAFIRNEGFYFKRGLSYGKRGKYLAIHTHPRGRIITNEGQGIFPPSDKDALYLLGILNSKICRALINEYCGQHKENGYVSLLPIPKADQKIYNEIVVLVSSIIEILRDEHCYELENFESIGLTRDYIGSKIKTNLDHLKAIKKDLDRFESEVEKLVRNLYNLSDEAYAYICQKVDGCPSIYESHFKIKEKKDFTSRMLFDQLIGLILGRWDLDVFLSKSHKGVRSSIFDFHPKFPPGLLLRTTSKQTYFSRFPDIFCENGILSSTKEDPYNLTDRVLKLIDLIWTDHTDRIEQDFCHLVNTHSIGEYINDPKQFFSDHLERYRKGRRVAPIYWPLSTPSCSYTLWLYYHRLNDQTLYSCVNDFVDPKLKQVSDEAARLRMKKGRSPTDEKELERLTDFERELKDFREELLCVAKFWKPNLNDGVEITAAPLWKLFQHKPWQKRLKETWQKLEAGEYDWAHLAYSIWPERVREKCKNDKSLAIAHDLEELYVELPASAKKKKARKPAVDEETEGWFNDD